MLETMGLTEAADRLVSTYSGGMIRRLELAQALVNRPRLLVLDEPTIGLDPIARSSVWERIGRLRAETGMTVLLTTHYMDEADTLCDRVAMMHRARLRALGTPEELKADLGADATLEDVFRHYTGTRSRRGAICGTSARPAAPRAGLASAVTIRRPVAAWQRSGSRVLALCLVELQKLRHDRKELYTRAIQPALWLLIFGETFSRLHAIPTSVPYLDYLAPGILAQSVLFISIFYGIQIIWERDAGVLAKLMATPTPRWALVAGKAFAAGVRALVQGVVVLVLAAVLGVALTDNPLRLVAVAVVVVLSAAFFSTLSIVLAGIVLSRERLMGIGQAITMPLFFASNALYPVRLMPEWLQILARLNPLSYEVDALRGLLLGTPALLVRDYSVLAGSAVLGVAAASSLLGRLTR
jgi:ABC-2 type transport system permease protein